MTHGKSTRGAKSGAALAGLVLGAVLIGLAPICVRLADVGPAAVGFWRCVLGLPLLVAMLLPGTRTRRAGAGPAAARRIGWLWLAGAAFAFDLALWHRSIHLTSVANATLLANLSPVVLALILHFGLGERHGWRFWSGLLLAFTGAVLLAADSLRIGTTTLAGDGLAASTAVFYAGYQLIVSRQRQVSGVVEVMFWSSLASSLLLLPIALAAGEAIWPAGLRGWMVLAGLAVVVHLGGQGLIAWALARVPAAFASVTLLVQPLAAAGFAWILLDERFGRLQALGGLVVLAGILLCRLALPAPTSRPD